MKIKLFDKVVNVLLLLCVLGFGVLCLGVAWGVFIPDLFGRFGAWLTAGTLNAVIVTAVCVVVLLLCVRIFFVRRRDTAAVENPQAPGILVRTGDNGAVFLTAAALEEMVLRQVKADTKVRDCTCDLAFGESSAAVRLHLFLAPDANIPETTAKVQASLKEYVEKMAGISLPEVQCVVEKTRQGQNDLRPVVR